MKKKEKKRKEEESIQKAKRTLQCIREHKEQRCVQFEIKLFSDLTSGATDQTPW